MPSRLTRTQWLICVIASIGFAFDIYELLMLPLVLLCVAIGVYPYPVLESTEKDMKRVVAIVEKARGRTTRAEAGTPVKVAQVVP